MRCLNEYFTMLYEAHRTVRLAIISSEFIAEYTLGKSMSLILVIVATLIQYLKSISDSKVFKKLTSVNLKKPSQAYNRDPKNCLFTFPKVMKNSDFFLVVDTF